MEGRVVGAIPIEFALREEGRPWGAPALAAVAAAASNERPPLVGLVPQVVVTVGVAIASYGAREWHLKKAGAPITRSPVRMASSQGQRN